MTQLQLWRTLRVQSIGIEIKEYQLIYRELLVLQNEKSQAEVFVHCMVFYGDRG